MEIKCFGNKLLSNLPVVLLILFCAASQAQKVNIPPKLFTTYNTQVRVAIGGDLSYTGRHGKFKIIRSTGQISDDNVRFREAANWSLNLGLDIYSPKSLISFYVGTGFNSQKYSIEGTPNQRIDSIKTKAIEIPVYLKFRFGKTTGYTHFWVAVGGGYSVPIYTRWNTNANGFEVTQPIKVDLFKPNSFVSGILAWEVQDPNSKNVDSNFGTLLYIKGNYDLQNRVNSTFVPPDDSALSQIDTIDLKLLRVSFGLIFLF